MQSFDSNLIDVKPLPYKRSYNRKESKQKIIIYGVFLFILFAIFFLSFKYISTISTMNKTIKELSSRLDNAMIQLIAIKQSLDDSGEYNATYGHLKSLFDA